ncbi:hypothetical protein [Nitrosopumilus spindle-shaped virus]|uniref:Uncharacterized protein n=1 Tax=Nitrosopumilus spindle-shaped virus TaxID=2508184 RepID=A0A514K369_9VIRU|nr:hypothetical protein [Nitrosopumilus spindle-shaped virus]
MINELLISLLISPLLFLGNSYQNTFCEVIVDGNTITCDGLKDALTLIEGNNISISVNNATDTLMINSTIPTPTTSSLGGVFSGQCNAGDYMVGILQSGGIICQGLPP